MNDIAIVTTEVGQVVLRGHRRTERRRVEFEHEVMNAARSSGVPVPEAVATPDGQVIVERDARFFSLFRHAPGVQIARSDLNEDHALAMGRCLAELHAALRTLQVADAPRAATGHSYADTLARIRRLLARIEKLDEFGEHEAWAVGRLESRAAWLAGRVDPAERPPIGEQLVHGDFHDANLHFAAGEASSVEVSSVIDWDKAEVRPRGQEVIRSMQLAFELDPAKCVAFLAGYRSREPLPDSELQSAAHSYGHLRDCDTWLLETIFIDGDNRLRRFLRPGPFIPFAQQWEPVAQAIRAI